jgi:hypothetical protein
MAVRTARHQVHPKARPAGTVRPAVPHQEWAVHRRAALVLHRAVHRKAASVLRQVVRRKAASVLRQEHRVAIRVHPRPAATVVRLRWDSSNRAWRLAR